MKWAGLLVVHNETLDFRGQYKQLEERLYIFTYASRTRYENESERYVTVNWCDLFSLGKATEYLFKWTHLMVGGLTMSSYPKEKFSGKFSQKWGHVECPLSTNELDKEY